MLLQPGLSLMHYQLLKYYYIKYNNTTKDKNEV